MHFFRCTLYTAFIGFASLLVGMLLPRSWFHPERFPYSGFSWEDNGRIYHKLHIRKWKDKMPDCSHFIAGLYPKKAMIHPDTQNLYRLLEESCVAEFTHLALILLSMGVMDIWPGPGGCICWLLCVLGNLPFILIQRYNRPRLLAVLERLTGESDPVICEHSLSHTL